MIRLVIADDHPIVRQGLQRIIGDCADMRMVGEAVDGNALLGVLESAEVDVLVLDISMPGPPFLDLMRQLRAQWPGLKILIVSAHPEDQYAVRALKSGAAGYLSKDRSTEELAEAIRRVYRGGRYITPTLAEQLAAQVGPNSELPSHERLSEQEYRVLCLYGAGKSKQGDRGRARREPQDRQHLPRAHSGEAATQHHRRSHPLHGETRPFRVTYGR